MNIYPLIRTKLSNEHLMAILFIVASLYQLPAWAASAAAAASYLLFVAAALLLDSLLNYIRYKKAVCAVSAAVTAAVLYPAVKGLPGWAALLGISAALIVGKHIWGGTGKNIFNPAVVGMFVLSMFFPAGLPLFEPSGLLLPAVLLSLPFVCIRIFPGVGFMAGMLLMLLLKGELSAASIISYGIPFWGCIVVTDPATSTDKPVAGAIIGLLAGFASLYFYSSIFSFTAVILLFNAASFLVSSFGGKISRIHLSGLKIKSPFTASGRSKELLDLSEKQPCKGCNPHQLGQEAIIEGIRNSEVYGMGGGGFPLSEKLDTVIRSGAKEKYAIINAMECDPGLLHDKWLMQNRADEIAKGAVVLERLDMFSKIYCATKENESFSLAAPVVMCRLPDKYPFGAERILTERILGISIPEDSNPAQYGILVLNVQTVLCLYEAVCCKERADSKFITVSDLSSGAGHVARVKLGQRIGEVVERTVGGKGMTFAGGGIMQAHCVSEDETIGRNTNFIAVGMLPRYKESVQCVNCGLCRLCCPRGLNVKKIAELVEGGRLLEAQALNWDSCLKCGICSYVCPAGRNLSGRMAGKNTKK